MKYQIFRSSLTLCAIAFGLTSAHAALVAHWPLDTDAIDATGNGHDGTVVGGTVDFGQPGANANTGSAASFPDNGHIDVPYDIAINPGTQAPNGAGSFTIALWANSSDTANFNSPFTAREDSGTVNGPIIYNTPGNVWSYWAGNNGPPGAWNALDHASGATVGVWQHVAITYDASSLTRKMFIDGAEALSANIGVSANVLRDTHIGSGQDDGNNFFWNGLIDDVGFWDEPLTETEIQSAMNNGAANALPDPRIVVPSTTALELAAMQSFNIVVTNGGETQPLNISTVDVSGANETSFSVATIPGAIAPGATGDIEIDFDALGGNGAFLADLEITSDDPLNGSLNVTVMVTVHDPKLVADPELDFGVFAAGAGVQSDSLPVQNDGVSRILNISAVNVTGADFASFSVTNFSASLAAGGGAGTIDVAFDPMGGDGGFVAQLEISSDDPVNATIIVPLIARVAVPDPLVAWWPLDNDSTDGSGNGFDGVDSGVVTYGQPGANAATGTAASFSLAEHIDVPWDPALNSEDFSVTLWVNPTAAGGGSFRSPITNRDDVAPGGAFRHGWIIYNNNGGQWSFWNGGGTAGDGGWNVMDVGPVAINEWHHLAITYDSATNTKNFFIDAASVGSSNPAAFSPNDSNIADGFTHEDEDLHIGGGGDDGTSFRWEGLLDDVGLFRTALAQQEIADIMSDGVGSVVNTAPFAITSLVRVSETEADVTWNSRSGVTYGVDRSVGSTTFDWIEQSDAVATSDTTIFNDDAIPVGSRDVFYRIRIIE